MPPPPPPPHSTLSLLAYCQTVLCADVLQHCLHDMKANRLPFPPPPALLPCHPACTYVTPSPLQHGTQLVLCYSSKLLINLTKLLKHSTDFKDNPSMQGDMNLTATQPAGARQVITNLQARLQAVMPRFQELLNTPGAAEIRAEMTRGLMERSLARAIKLVFNQEQPSAEAQPLGRRQQGGLAADVGRRPTGGLTAGTMPTVQRL